MTLPLRAILFQCLFLCLAIAIESLILRWRLGYGRQTSVEYAASMNFLSTVVGWVTFFIAQPLLPAPLREQLIGYVLFDQFYSGDWLINVNTLLIVVALGTFFGTFVIELKGLDLLEFILSRNQPVEEPTDKPVSRYYDRLNQQRTTRASRNRALVILIANAFSYTAILGVLVIRFFMINVAQPVV